jgi:large subunit ribosomal protein L25
MIQITIDANVRNQAGKGAARKMRHQGEIPGVLYGPRIDPIALSVNEHDFNRIIFKTRGEQVIFTINLGSNGSETGKEGRLALIKELQRHPVNDRIRHIDFYAISIEEKIKIEVPVTPVGKAKGVEISDGVLELIQRTVAISCLPLAIPREIELDVSDLDVGDALHVKDLTPPEGVEFIDPPDTTLLTVVGAAAPAVEEEEIEEEEEAITEEEETEE